MFEKGTARYEMIDSKSESYLSLQPLRIPPNWTMKLNKLSDIDPQSLAPEDRTWLFAFNEDIISMESVITRRQNKQIEEQKLIIDLGWYPDGEPEGSFLLQAVLNEDWVDPLMKFSSRSKDEIVKTLEKWLWEDFMPLRFIG